MASLPAKPNLEEEIEEDYESDEYDVEDDDGDEYQEGGDEDDDEDEDGEAPQENGKSLTALLLAENNGAGDLDDEEDDGYTPDGLPDPANLPIDGNARELAPENAGDEPETAKDAIPPVAAPSLKRKTSGDEDDEDEEEELEETEAKKIKT